LTTVLDDDANYYCLVYFERHLFIPECSGETRRAMPVSRKNCGFSYHIEKIPYKIAIEAAD